MVFLWQYGACVGHIVVAKISAVHLSSADFLLTLLGLIFFKNGPAFIYDMFSYEKITYSDNEMYPKQIFIPYLSIYS